MNIKRNFLLLAALMTAFSVSAESPHVEPISEGEAYEIVAERQAAKDARHQALMQELGSADIVTSKAVTSGDGTLIINAIKPIEMKKPVEAATTSSSVENTTIDWSEYQTKFPEQISMRANVYGEEYSEITWRDRETNSEFVVWTNVSLNYLRPINTIPDKEYDYTYFGFVTNYTQEGEAERIAFAEQNGYYGLESRWKMPPVEFSPDQYEYVVMMTPSNPAPDKLYRQMNAALGYYVANSEKLETEHHNLLMLEKARLKYLEENPPAPKQTMINFWKVESETTGN